jgi:hypothetical protein
LLTDFASQPKIWMWEDLRAISQGFVRYFFVSDAIILNYGSIDHQRMFYLGQQPDVVLFPTAREDVPDQYIGLTNQQLWDRYGIAMGGMVAPSNTFAVPYVGGGTVAYKS